MSITQANPKMIEEGTLNVLRLNIGDTSTYLLRTPDGSLILSDIHTGDISLEALILTTSIRQDHIFTSDTARNTYFDSPDPHLSELRTGLLIVSNGVIQQWVSINNPTTYDASNWNTNASLLTALEVKTLYESNPNTEVLETLKKQILDQISETTEEIVFSKAIFAPSVRAQTGSFNLSNITLSSNSVTTEIREGTRDNGDIREIITSKYNDLGSEVPMYPDKSSLTNIIVQTENDEQNGSFQFLAPVIDDNTRQGVYFRGVIVEPKETGTGIFTLRYMNVNGEVLVSETNITFTQEQVDNNEDVPLLLENTTRLYNGEIAFVSYSGPAIAGHTFVNDPTFGSGFFPKLITRSHNFTDKPMATQEYVQNLIGNQIELTNFSINIPSRVDIDTDLSGVKTIMYNVVGYNELTELSLQIDGTDSVSIPLPTSDGIQSINITLPSISTSSQKTLRFRVQGNNMDNSNVQLVQVRNIPQSEIIYTGVSSTNNPSTIDITTLTQHNVISGSSFNFDFNISSNSYAIILIPNNLTASITERTFNTPITDDFNISEDIRTINNQLYDGLVHQNQSDTQGILSTTINIT